MSNIKFNHTLSIQLRFNDIDKFGHVNNSAYFTYYDLGKTEYLSEAYPQVNWKKEGIVVAHIDVDFLQPIFASDTIAVQTTVTEIGDKSFQLYQQVIDTQTKEIKCICRSTMVGFNLETQQSVPLSEECKKSLCTFEGRDLRRKKTTP
ncbi:MAG: acyl-CoA thioesterase [Bacteroidales bacterium]|nr:acyl-CoA thioesterase [Bacteroidales bacterium]